jgi:hypothetical protein
LELCIFPLNEVKKGEIIPQLLFQRRSIDALHQPSNDCIRLLSD